MITPGKTVIIAVSGGSDSSALLHILSVLYPENPRIGVYIDHGMRPYEKIEEEEHLKNLTAACNASFISVSVDVPGEVCRNRGSVEETARNLRYEALEKIRGKYEGHCIAVGHTSDDQAEEVLLRLIRGTGSGGLGGMALSNNMIIRPLLHESRKDLRRYLHENEISFCEDSSNLDPRFLRNRIRHHLLPLLEQVYNRSMQQVLLRTASILHDEDDLLDQLSLAAYQDTVITVNGLESRLHLAPFHQLHSAIQRRIFEKICWQMASRPSYKHIVGLQKLAGGDSGSELHLPAGLRACKEQETIIFKRPSAERGYRGPARLEKLLPPLTINCPGTFTIPELGYRIGIEILPLVEAKPGRKDCLLADASIISFPLVLRHYLPGETFRPMGAPGSRKVSRFLTDQKIPAHQKDSFPVLVSDKTIVGVMGLRIDHRFRIGADTGQCLRIIWQKIE